MGLFIYQAKNQKCFLPYGTALGGGRYKCWWCGKTFKDKASWRKHASR